MRTTQGDVHSTRIDLFQVLRGMAAYEQDTGGNVLAIAHNGNLSNGIMFPDVEAFGKPLDAEYVETRARWEPLYEVTQIKGDGDAHPFLKNGDVEIIGWETLASGYAAVWATENTREAIFDAMERKETYATTGPRMIVRFFGGWNFDENDAATRSPASIGDTELITTWRDPDFHPDLKAFYYARVLEIPTPRWTAYDARYFGVEIPEGATTTSQERAYTSPIWYAP